MYRRSRKASRRRSRSRRAGSRKASRRRSRSRRAGSRKASRRRASFGMRKKYDIPDDFKNFWLGPRDPDEKSPQNHPLFEPRTLGLIGQYLGNNFPFKPDGKVVSTRVRKIDAGTILNYSTLGFVVVAKRAVKFYNNDGKKIQKVPVPFNDPKNVCFNSDYGKLYVSDFTGVYNGGSCIRVLELKEKWEYTNTISFDEPTYIFGMAVDRKDNILISRSNFVGVYNSDGQWLKTYPDISVRNIRCDISGRIYCSTSNDRILVYTDDFELIKTFDVGSIQPNMIHVSSGGKYVIFYSGRELTVLNTDDGTRFVLSRLPKLYSFCFNGRFIFYINFFNGYDSGDEDVDPMLGYDPDDYNINVYRLDAL